MLAERVMCEFRADSLDVSGDPSYEELVTRTLAESSELNLIFGSGAGDCVLGTSYGAPMAGASSLQGNRSFGNYSGVLAGNTCNGCRSRTVLTDSQFGQSYWPR